MMNDIRFQRMAQEYLGLRESQDKIMDGLDQILPAMAMRIEENSAKLDAIIDHLDVPYKPPMGFGREQQENE